MNPTSRIPTIEDGGFTLWESHAIVRYLARKHGAGSWWPDDPRTLAVADQWMDWPYNLAYPQLIRAFLGLYRTPENERDDDTIARAPPGLRHGIARPRFASGAKHVCRGRHADHGRHPRRLHRLPVVRHGYRTPRTAEPRGLVRAASGTPGVSRTRHDPVELSTSSPYRHHARKRDGLAILSSHGRPGTALRRDPTLDREAAVSAPGRRRSRRRRAGSA